ncbi:MAG: hypothetical protein ACU837_02935 [Gammaproteobacteria bacterium]
MKNAQVARLSTLFFEAKLQWQENQRLRMALWLIIWILAFHLCGLMSDTAERYRKQNQQLNAKLLRLTALEKQSFWFERVQEAKTRREALKRGLWLAENRALALADAQSWMNRTLEQLKLPTIRFQMEPVQSLGKIEGVWEIKTLLSGNLQYNDLLKFIKTLESAPYYMTIEEASIEKIGEAYTVTFLLRIFFSLNEN